MLFKDKRSINHRNSKDYLSNIELLARMIRDPNSYDAATGLFRDVSFRSSIEHEPKHTGCDPFGITNSITRLTEKRMCKCMYYYAKDSVKCDSCKLDYKWKNVGSIKVIECEVPTQNVVSTVGGVDLILQDASGEIYSTEVKPQRSNETLVRMMAEAFTIIAVGGPKDYPSCRPAICFFENSKQYDDFFNPEIQNSKAFQYLLTRIKVFYITTKQKDGLIEFIIHDIAEQIP